jgi:cell division protein FtsQ
VTKTSARSSLALERRKQLRQERRQERWKQIWRIAVLSGSAGAMGWLLLQQGWVVRNPSQIEVIGSRQVNRERVIQEGKLRLPLQLLTLRPQQLAAQLSAGLPVEYVQVSRLMLPPRLQIKLVDREAVAQAQRRTRTGFETGFVDRLGNWMTRRQHEGGSNASAPTVMVVGWQEHLRPPLSQVLAQRNHLGSPLQQVRFEPNGSLWLRTAALGDIHLGPPDTRLPERLDVLRHLSKELPEQIRSLKVQSIDLTDPDQPELGLPAKPVAKTAATPAPAAD